MRSEPFVATVRSDSRAASSLLPASIMLSASASLSSWSCAASIALLLSMDAEARPAHRHAMSDIMRT